MREAIARIERIVQGLVDYARSGAAGVGVTGTIERQASDLGAGRCGTADVPGVCAGETQGTIGNGIGKTSSDGTGNGNENGNGHALKGHYMNGQNSSGQLTTGLGDHGHAPTRTGAAGEGYVLDTTRPHVEESIGPFDLKSHVAAVERVVILRALEASGGNRRQAASLLGVSLRTLFYKLRRIPAA